MNNSEILKLIKVKELKIKKLQLEIDKLKKQFNEITTNSSEDISSREDSVKIFMNYFKGRNDVYPYLSIDKNNADEPSDPPAFFVCFLLFDILPSVGKFFSYTLFGVPSFY